MADGFYRLTYRDIADKLGISPDAARMKANRKAKAGHWRLLPDETPGQERLVEIPSAELDDLLAKAARQAERSAPVERAEQAIPTQPTKTAERPAPAPTAEQPAPADPAATAERSASAEPYVPPRVSISYDPQHPHLPPATTERSASDEPAEHAAPAEQATATEQSALTEQAVEGEQAVEDEQSAQTEQPASADQAVQAEPHAEPEPAAAAETAGPAEHIEVQPEARSADNDLDEDAEPETGDALVSTLTTRVATLTNRLLEETSAREKASEELAASAVREGELKVEIERLSARVSELSAELERGHRPWWRRFVQGSPDED